MSRNWVSWIWEAARVAVPGSSYSARSVDGGAARQRDLAEAAAAAARGDHESALATWNRYGQAGDAVAQFEIGRCFLAGHGVARDVEMGRRWLTLAARGAHPIAQRLLADLYFNGQLGVPQPDIAEEWYARAAKLGDAAAQDMLSWILTEGGHRAPDYPSAREWALKAAEQGVASAMTRLGLLYNNALGVERDTSIAAQWWRKSALLGDADAQALLGAAHHLGAGVARDQIAALAWLTRAKAGGSAFADRYLSPVSAACDPAAASEAALRARRPLALEDGS